jgi:shikimate dehydrogenase
MCESLTEDAEQAESVNSLRLRDGKVEGHSSDVVAFRELLRTGRFAGFDTVLVLGSGGSARAAVVGAQGKAVVVGARSRAKAHDLHNVVVEWGTPVEGALLVNATPLGMEGETLPAQVLAAADGLIDLPYGGETTPSVLDARHRQLPFVDGVEFLARQAQASFEWWTDVVVELDVLVRAARNV